MTALTHDSIFRDMPNPTPEQLASPEFAAIWEVIKSWDVSVPEFYEGYCGANGSHVVMILDALKGVVLPVEHDTCPMLKRAESAWHADIARARREPPVQPSLRLDLTPRYTDPDAWDR